MTARLQDNFDIRIRERERIARELHDTLLQGFQGLMLRFQAVANRLPPGGGSRESLEEALTRADAALIEGRTRILELRSLEPAADLATSLIDTASQFVGRDGPRVHLTREGVSRALHPLIREEVERIADEALRNAVNHAEASTIEILLYWGRREMRLAIRDDGVGMPPSVLAAGEHPGRFGLVGMRERAQQIGGRLAVKSREGAGTEITLTLPARVAYRDYPHRLRDRLRLLRGRPAS